MRINVNVLTLDNVLVLTMQEAYSMGLWRFLYLKLISVLLCDEFSIQRK